MQKYFRIRYIAIISTVMFLHTINCTKPSPEQQWIDTTIKKMSLEEKVGQLVDLWLDARRIADESYLKDRIDEIQNYYIGSYMYLVYVGDMYDIARGSEKLKQASKYPLLVGAISETGAGGYVKQAVRFPTQMAVAATRDSSLAYQVGRITALENRALGVEMDVSPHGSLNNNPDNPVINMRAFSDDPHLAATMAVAYIRGLQDNGMPAMISLFPGHGDTDVDSHLDLPTLNVHSRERLFSVELVPFIAAFNAGCASIMTAHVIIPYLDQNNPATLSKIIQTDLLRKELHYDGLVYTDAIRMGAITKKYGIGESAVIAFEAGCDIIAWPSDYKVTIDSLVAAVRSGRITEKRLHQSLERRLRVKAMAGVDKYVPHKIENLESKIGLAEYKEIAQKIADKAITVAKDGINLLPLKDIKQVGFLMFNGADIYAKEIRTVFPDCPILNIVSREQQEGIEIDPDPTRVLPPGTVRPKVTTAKTKQELLRRLQDISVVVIPAFLGRGVKPETNRGYFETLAQLVKSGKKVCLVSLGDPYIYRYSPSVQTYICTFGADEYLRNAAWKILKGEIPAQGKLPIKIPGM